MQDQITHNHLGYIFTEVPQDFVEEIIGRQHYVRAKSPSDTLTTIQTSDTEQEKSPMKPTHSKANLSDVLELMRPMSEVEIEANTSTDSTGHGADRILQITAEIMRKSTYFH